MGRDVKDEQLGDSAAEEPMPQALAPIPAPTIQLQLTESEQNSLVDIAMEDWDSAKTARGARDYGTTSKGERLNFDKWLDGLRDLYNGQRIPKEIPWKYCSNRSLRIGTAILDLLHSRIFPAVLSEDALKWLPGDTTDQMKVERIQKFMRWWMFVRSKQRDFFDNWVKMQLAFGDGLTETNLEIDVVDSGTEQKPITDPSGEQLINPDGTPAVSESPILKKTETTKSKIFLKENIFLQEHSRDIQNEPVILRDFFFYRELEEGEIQGKFVNVSTKLKDLIPVAGATGDDATDQKMRSVRLRNKPVEVIKWYGNYDANGDGFAENVRILIVPQFRLYLGGVSVKDITKSGKRPIDFTKLESRLECPDENDGIGVLEKVRELAEEIDAIFNQMSDANTLSVMRPGFYDPSGDLEASALNLAPNKISPVTDPSRNVYFPETNIPTERMIMAIRLVIEFIERLTAASSYVMGKESEIVGGSGTATRTQAIMQSAEQRFALPAERLRAGAARIIKTHLDIVQLNVPPGLESRILGENGEPVFKQNEITEEGIAGEFDAFLMPDMSLGSKDAERQLSQMLYSILLNNIIVGSDPAKIYKVTADLLKAYDKDPEEYLGPAPDVDMVDDPEKENTLIIQGDFGRVVPQMVENHMLHIQRHMELLQSPSVAQVPRAMLEQVIGFTQQHIMQHQQMMQAMMGLIGKFGGGGKSVTGGGTNPDNESGGEVGGAKGAQGESGLETLQGPIAKALATKRTGQVAGPAQ